MNQTLRDDHGPHGSIRLEAGPNQHFELEITHPAGGRQELIIRELSHGTGVGWFVQKTIRLDSGQFDGLLKALCCLRPSCGAKRSLSEGCRVEGCPVISEAAISEAVAVTSESEAASTTAPGAPQGQGEIIQVDFSAR